MTRLQRVMRKEAAVRGGSPSPRASGARSKRRTRRRTQKSGASGSAAKKKPFSVEGMKIADFYRPLKKPITVRIDADVLAWFKKDGRRYQTRINDALRKTMEREMRETR